MRNLSLWWDRSLQIYLVEGTIMVLDLMSFVWQRRIRPVSYPLMKLMWLLPSVLIHNAQTGPFLICWIIWMGFIIKRRMSRLLWRRIGWIRLMLLCWDLEDWIVGMSFLNRLVGRGVWFLSCEKQDVLRGWVGYRRLCIRRGEKMSYADASAVLNLCRGGNDGC